MNVFCVNRDGSELAETEIAVSGDGYYPYTLIVPGNACVMDGLTGHKTKLNLVDSTVRIGTGNVSLFSNSFCITLTLFLWKKTLEFQCQIYNTVAMRVYK